MCISKAYEVLSGCRSKYTKLVKDWMVKQGIKCIKQNIFEALVVLKYNGGTKCWPRLVKPLKDQDWQALAAAVATDPYASAATKKYVVALIHYDNDVNWQEDVRAPKQPQVPALFQTASASSVARMHGRRLRSLLRRGRS
jgi:hypothetical protein